MYIYLHRIRTKVNIMCARRGHVCPLSHVQDGVWAVGKSLGSGSFGEVYECTHVQTGEEYAVKFEDTTTDSKRQLSYENAVYAEIQKAGAWPNMSVLYFGHEGKYDVMVMPRYGKNLQTMSPMPTKIGIMIAIFLMDEIQQMHNAGFVHRDIKPANVMISRDNMTIYLRDVGLAKKFRHSNGRHIEYCEHKGLVGTPRYASMFTHRGQQSSRRDDMESIMYTLVDLVGGGVPWKHMGKKKKKKKRDSCTRSRSRSRSRQRRERNLAIYNAKRDCDTTELFRLIGPHSASVLRHIRNLPFLAKPDYAGYTRALLKDYDAAPEN